MRKEKTAKAKVVAAKEKAANRKAKGKVVTRVKPSCYHARDPRGARLGQSTNSARKGRKGGETHKRVTLLL